jgi:hypothetical protein
MVNDAETLISNQESLSNQTFKHASTDQKWGEEIIAVKKPRRGNQGQFLIVAAILIAVLTLSVAVSISQMSLQRQEQKYEPVRELTLGITSDLERALSYALSKASQYYYQTYNSETAKTVGNESISRWVRSVVATYAHLGLKLDVATSPNSFSFSSWWSETALSPVDAVFDMDVDGYGFKGWTGHSAKYVMLRIFPEFIDVTQPDRTTFEFQITQSSLSEDEGIPIPNLTKDLIKISARLVGPDWIPAQVIDLEYLGGGNYSVTFSPRVNEYTLGVALVALTPEDNIAICASHYDDIFVNLHSSQDNLDSENRGGIQFGTEFFADGELPQNYIQTYPGSYILRYVAASTYSFLNWTTDGYVSVADPFSGVTAVNVEGNCTITAFYTLPTTPPPLTANIQLDSRDENNSVNSLGSIVLGTDTYGLPSNAEVILDDYTLLYTPDPEYVFLRWEFSGQIYPFSATDNPTTLRVLGDGNITAVYSNSTVPPLLPVSVDLNSLEDTLTSSNLGMIQLAADSFALPNSADVYLGTYLIEFTPAQGYTFLNWTATENITIADPHSQTTSVKIDALGTITAFYRGCKINLNSRYWESPSPTNLGQITLDTTTYTLPNALSLPSGDYALEYTPYNSSYVFLWWECEPLGTVIPWDGQSIATTLTIHGDGNLTAVYDFTTEPTPPPPPGDWSTLFVDKDYKIVPPYMWSGKNSHLPSRASTGLGKQEVILTSPPSPTIYLADLVNVTAYIRPNPPNAPMRLVELELGFEYDGQYYTLGYAGFNVTTGRAQEVYSATFDIQYGEFTQEYGRGVIPEGSTIIFKAYVTFVTPPGGTFFLYYGPNRPSNIQLF